MEHTTASRVIPANEYRRARWRNGQGWTRGICAGEASTGGWEWRLSIAEIEAPSCYSAFPGVEREQVLLRGEGLALAFADGRHERLEPPYGRIRFDGGQAPDATPDGRVEVFNLMWQRQRVAAELWHRPLVGPMLFFAEPGIHWALHLLAGDARFDAMPLPALAQGDTAVLAEPCRRRFLLEGGGELLVIRLRSPVAGGSQ